MKYIPFGFMGNNNVNLLTGNWSEQQSVVRVTNFPFKSMCSIDENNIVVVTRDTNNVYYYIMWFQKQSGNWVRIGNINNLEMFGLYEEVNDVAKLSYQSNTVAVSFRSIIATLSWNGTNFSLVGSIGTLPDSGLFSSMVPLTSNTVSVYQGAYAYNLKTMSFNGTNWSLVGNTLYVGDVAGGPGSNVRVNNNTIVLSRYDNNVLYYFNGTDYISFGTPLNGAASGPTIYDGSVLVSVKDYQPNLYTWQFYISQYQNINNSWVTINNNSPYYSGPGNYVTGICKPFNNDTIMVLDSQSWIRIFKFTLI